MGKLCTLIETHFSRVLTACFFNSVYTGTGDHCLILIVFLFLLTNSFGAFFLGGQRNSFSVS